MIDFFSLIVLLIGVESWSNVASSRCSVSWGIVQKREQWCENQEREREEFSLAFFVLGPTN